MSKKIEKISPREERKIDFEIEIEILLDSAIVSRHMVLEGRREVFWGFSGCWDCVVCR